MRPRLPVCQRLVNAGKRTRESTAQMTDLGQKIGLKSVQIPEVHSLSPFMSCQMHCLLLWCPTMGCRFGSGIFPISGCPFFGGHKGRPKGQPFLGAPRTSETSILEPKTKDTASAEGEEGILQVRESLCNVDAETAGAWCAEDEKMVKRLIEQTIGRLGLLLLPKNASATSPEQSN